MKIKMCLWCKEKPARKKFCSYHCGHIWHNAQRLVSLGYVRGNRKTKSLKNCKQCGKKLSGLQRKFCSPRCGVDWFGKNNPESRRAAARKYGKKNRHKIHQTNVRNKWLRIAGVESFAEFQKLELKKIKKCSFCGSIFHSKYPTRKRCSLKCDFRDEYKKKKLKPKWSHERFRVLISCCIRNAIKRKTHNKKSLPTEVLIGCSIPQLRIYIESLFKDGMTWENMGRNGWHIDHIRPCSSFNLSDVGQQKKCFHYTNLQPLWEADNIRKSDKWIPKVKLPVRKTASGKKF